MSPPYPKLEGPPPNFEEKLQNYLRHNLKLEVCKDQADYYSNDAEITVKLILRKEVISEDSISVSQPG